MASRVSLIQSRSIYVGTSNAVAPSAGDLVVSNGGMIGVSSQFTFGGTAKLSVYADAPITFALSNTDAVYFRRYGAGKYQFQTTSSGGNNGDLSLQSYGGNVGIGTTAPTSKLFVLGSGTYNTSTSEILASDATIFSSEMSNNSYNSILQLVSVRQSLTTGNASNGFLGFSTIDDSNAQGVRDAGRIAIVNEVGSSRNSATALSFWTNSGGTNTTAATEKLRITSAGNVGIGTTSPVEKLHISSGQIQIGDSSSNFFGIRLSRTNTAIVQDAHLYSPSNNSPSVFYIEGGYYSGEASGTVTAANSGYAYYERYFGNGAASSYKHLGFINVANGNFTSTNLIPSIAMLSNGNVGIGTTSPSQKLHVVGNGLYTGNLDVGHSVSTGDAAINLGTGRTGNGFAYIDLIGDTTYTDYGLRILRNNGGANTTSSIVHRGTGNFSIQNNEAANLVFLTAATERMRITSDGNVAINSTTTSGYRLYVNGSTWINGGTNFQDGVSIFRTESGAAEVMRIASNGNVGIGTTSPTTFLTVSGQGNRTGGNIQVGAQGEASYKYGWITSTHYNATSEPEGFSLIGGLAGPTNNTVYIGGYIYESNTATEIVFHTHNATTHGTGGSERMRITSAGNVGIGTTSPSTLLNVMTATNAVDVLRLDNSGGNSGSVQGVTHLAINHFGTGTNPSTRITAYQDGVSGWPGGMYFSTRSLNTDSAPVERMRITSGGNVGIGTTTPQYMLDVNGDAQINASGTGPAYAYQPDGAFGLDSLVTSSIENVALGKPDIWLRIHVDGVAFVFPGYQE